jgi:hypothetical protein
MPAVQLALASKAYSNALSKALQEDRSFRTWQVLPVDRPDFNREGVVVVDDEALDRLLKPLPSPERIVLITRGDPAHFDRAWDAGIVSVVGERDSVATATLAILAARCRAARCPQSSAPAA